MVNTAFSPKVMSTTPSSHPISLSTFATIHGGEKRALNDLLHADLGVELATVFGRIKAEEAVSIESSRRRPVSVHFASVVFLASFVQPACIVHSHCVTSLGIVYTIPWADDLFL